jgi:hypothetical protein
MSYIRDRRYTRVERAMPNYANGKIYKIVGEDGSTYYGSTTQSLKGRINGHIYSKQTMAYQKIISKMDYEVVLIENYPCESRKELELREGTYIRDNVSVNWQVAGRTIQEWMEDHREESNSRSKKHYQDNHEQKLAYAKIRGAWTCSFGDPRFTNSVQRCDYKLFQ